MWTVLRLCAPNLAAVLAIALAPLLTIFLQARPIAAPTTRVVVQITDETTGAQAGLEAVGQRDAETVEPLAAIR